MACDLWPVYIKPNLLVLVFLMHKRDVGWLQGAALPFSPQVAGGKLAEFPVHQVCQFLRRLPL
jgi:hypothetical protein